MLMDGIDVAKLMMGQNAFQVPLNIIFQDTGTGDSYAGVFQFRHAQDQLKKWIGQHPHLMILGDAIIRPRVVVASRVLVGQGMAGVYRDGFLQMMESIGSDKTAVLMDDLHSPQREEI
jgi:hypothetical protein